MSRIVLFGATGYTGALTARALVDRGQRPLLAGRSADKLERLAADLGGGLETQVADVADAASVRALVQRGDVLITTVGPFSRWGQPAVLAAVDAGAHYLDSTGEGPFIRQVFERHSAGAVAAGCGLLTAFGYDWVPGNLAGALALREAGPAAVRVEIGYFVEGGAFSSAAMSGGTRASATGAMLEPAFAWRGGRLVTERGAKRLGAFELQPGRRAAGVSIGGSEHFALPRVHPGLRDVDVYLGWFGPLSRPLQGFSLATSLATRVPGVKAAFAGAGSRLVRGSSGGPDAPARARTGSIVVGRALGEAGSVLSEVRLEGINAYDFTGRILAWGAERALEGGLQSTGALGPVDGFGLEALQAGVAEAGITRS